MKKTKLKSASDFWLKMDQYENKEQSAFNTKSTDIIQLASSQRAISNFVEDKAGTEWFNLLIPVNNLTNNTSNRYIANSAQITTNSYNINTISVDIQQVFDV